MTEIYSSVYPLPEGYRAFELIATRRSLKPERMRNEPLDPGLLRQLLDAAQWAPNHGRTEPWRFIHFASAASRDELAGFMRQGYNAACKDRGIAPKGSKLEKFATRIHCGGALLGIWCQRGINPNIPPAEDLWATACAVQNVALAATHFGVSAYWSTGWAAHHSTMQDLLRLPDEGQFMGLLYLGYPLSDWPAGQRQGMQERIEVR